ncbi:glycosyl hydrolase family 18 protein [Paenibacillus sp. WC2504]|uniref:glycosyl hydrolase family 18 protein n=1 Tax=Paenibacillus sp. WC2504 TaxID=3461403 RepID=UPI004045997A
MFIYTVKSGDSLYTISRKYQVSLDTIRSVNGLNEADLVPGQALIMATTTYIVQQGDTLSSIASISYVPSQLLKTANGLESDALTVGMRLTLPTRPKYLEEGLSYILPSTPEQIQKTVQNFANLNTYFGVFEYHITADGNLSELPYDDLVIKVSRDHLVAPLATITNLTPGGFSSDITKQLLQSPELRNRLIDNIYTLLKTKNYTGVNVDFERIRADERDLYSGFLRALNERLKPDGYYTSVAVPVKRSDLDHPGYDYGGIASSVNFVFIMAYDFHEAHSGPGPVGPIDEIRKTVEYALQHMPRHKIILGVPRYGFDWTMEGNVPLTAKAVSVKSATDTAIRYEVNIQYSEQYQQPYFGYWDEQGRRHIVWFEDARARAAKCQLVIDYQLLGIGAWQLGLNFPQSAYLIMHFFRNRRVV